MFAVGCNPLGLGQSGQVRILHFDSGDSLENWETCVLIVMTQEYKLFLCHMKGFQSGLSALIVCALCKRKIEIFCV